MSEDIQVVKNAGVITIELTRPEKRNAITSAMYGAMAAAFQDAEDDLTVRAIIVKGQGGVFTGGNDLADFLGSPQFGMDAPVNLFLKAMMLSTVPVVAAVDGHAVGIGTTMLLHFDRVIVTKGARLSMPFVDLGLVPEAASSLLLPLKVGYTRAAELLLTGRGFSGEEAIEYQIATDIVDTAEEAYALADEAAQTFAAKPPRVMRQTKKLMKGDTTKVLEQMQAEGELFAEALASPECHEAIQAFTEGRQPDFSRFSA